MTRAGIDVQEFGAHSVRCAAVSTAHANHVPISKNFDKAGWSNEIILL